MNRVNLKTRKEHTICGCGYTPLSEILKREAETLLRERKDEASFIHGDYFYVLVREVNDVVKLEGWLIRVFRILVKELRTEVVLVQNK